MSHQNPDASEIQRLLNRGMGVNLHWFPEDVPVTRLAEVMVGMANSRGGTVLIGVAPRAARLQGVNDPRQALDKVFQSALLSDPPLVIPIPHVKLAGETPVVVVSIPDGLPNVYSLEGRYLGREGARTDPLSARDLRRLLVERGVVQFESQMPPDAALEDLDFEKIRAYLDALELSVDEPPEASLLRRGALKRVDGELRPTYAALLLFGRQPQSWLSNATILAARFPGTAFSDQYLKQDIGGSLPEQIRQAEAFARQNMRSVVRLVGLTHQETYEYPPEAVRELLVNAVAHRDYNQQGDSIHLNIFADRIEVHSPGGLPGPVNLDNLLKARFSRNAVIVQVLSDQGFVERLGYGLDRVVSAVREYGLPEPKFEEVAGSFRVTLFGRPEQAPAEVDLSAYKHLNLNERQEQALGYLAARRRITNREYQELCPDVHPETLRRDLADLVARGVLIKVGQKRATYYILK